MQSAGEKGDTDGATIDSVVRALYEVISGPAGAPRDWERERRLLHPAGRLIPTRVEPDGRPHVDVLDVDGYVASRTPLFEKQGVYEWEIARETFRFGNIAHVLSAYELRRAPDEAPYVRGINSIQLFHDGQRWWVMNVFWDNERPGNPLPVLRP